MPTDRLYKYTFDIMADSLEEAEARVIGLINTLKDSEEPRNSTFFRTAEAEARCTFSGSSEAKSPSASCN